MNLIFFVHSKTIISRPRRFQSLKDPAQKRREALEESLRFHKFGFELDAELHWIKDHLPQASSTALGQNLYQAQSLHKKHKKLEAEIAGHQPMIDKTLASGASLIDQVHPERRKVVVLITCLRTNSRFELRTFARTYSSTVRIYHFCIAGAPSRFVGPSR